MVKSTRKEVVDNSQSKISSFFGKGTNSNGKLFTTVGSSKLRLPKRKDNVIITDNAPPDKSLPFKASRNPEIHSIEKGPCNSKPNSSTFFTIIQNPAAKNVSQNKITKSEPIEHLKHSSSHAMNDLTNSFNKSDQGSDQHDLDKQTVKSSLKISSLSSQSLTPKTSSDSEPLLLSSSPTFPKTKAYNSVHVIPETPESKPRKVISRTFLASSAQLKNTVENKINQAKNVELLKMRTKTKRPKPCVANPVKERAENSDLSKTSIKDSNLSHQTVSSSLAELTTTVGSVTPVKKYTNSTKRLAKTGISPSAKRNIFSESCPSEKDVGEDILEEPEDDTPLDFQTGSVDLSDNEIEMWEELSTKGAEVWDDLGLSLVEKSKEELLNEIHLNPINKAKTATQLTNQKTGPATCTNKKTAVSEEVAQQKTDMVDQLTNQEDRSAVTVLTNHEKIPKLFLKQDKETSLKQQNYQMSWSFKSTGKKCKSKMSSTEDETLLLEILGEIDSVSNSKPAKTKPDPQNETLKKTSPNIQSQTTHVDCVVPPSQINQTEDRNLLQEILGELNEGKNTVCAKTRDPYMTGIKNEMSATSEQRVEAFINETEQPPTSNSLLINISQVDDNQESNILSEKTCDINHETGDNLNNCYAASKANFAQEMKTNIDENKLSVEGYEYQDFSPWDSSFEIEEPALDGSQISVAKNLKHFDQAVDDILSSSLDKLSPFKPRTKCPKKTLPPVAPACASYNRFQVDNVQHHHGNDKIELTLLNGNCARTCILYGFWCDSHVVPGDVVNVLGVSPDSSGVYHITNQEGLLVINPDTLVSGTSIVSTLFCMRKAILNERFKGIDKGNVHMLYGSVIHCLFQEVMQKKLSEEEQLLEVAQKVIRRPNFLKDMYGQGMTESAAMEEIVKYIPSIVTWIKKHTTFAKTPISAGNQTMVTEIRDIEENIWSPRFGMKGKIDLTVEVKIKNKRKKIVPLELKTGRSSFSAEHKGQVTLYSMMSCDRQGDPGEGLLLYLKDQPLMDTIPADQQNKRGLIQLRNELVDYLQNSLKQQSPLPSDLSVLLGNLPEPISNQRACPKCPHLLNCSLYQKSMPQMQPPSRNWSNLLETTLSHLSKPHLDYFVRWCVMMEMENCSKKSGEAVKGIWCSSGIDRELKGECLSNLQLSMSEKLPDSEKFLNTFERHPLSKLKQEFASLDTIGLCSQESVAVSAESKNQVVLCTGNIYKITPENVVVISDRNLQAEPDFASLVFRVDKCDTYNTWGTCYCNLSILMSDSAHCARLRELIIDHQKPRLQTTLPKSLILKVKTVFKPLNTPQRASVLKVLMSEDYVIVRGYPGTGKTSTIVALIKVLTNLGLSILLASYTHSAVDNILLKLKKEKVEFLRLGRKERIHPEIYPFSEDFLIKSVTNVEELKKLYESKRVVATTCLGSNHVLFSTQHQMFDVCIVDEASQVTQLACIGPLFSAKKFILVGDSKQLPPVVQSKQAKALGMDQSLFELLENQGASVELHLQYRMNSEIMALSNELMYEGCLKCGTVEVSAQTIKLINIDSLKKMLPFWLHDIMSEDLEKSVVFANTVKVPGRECYNSRGEVMNEIEAHLVAMIVHALFLAGVSAFEIGVIAPYRNQVKLVQKTLVSVLEGQPVQTVEVNTVDQYQGRDKDVIIVTFVRSQSHNNFSNPCSGELLKDGRRLNVAVTRAKKKLILVGDVTTLEKFEPLAKILPLLRKKNQITELPPEAHMTDLSRCHRLET